MRVAPEGHLLCPKPKGALQAPVGFGIRALRLLPFTHESAILAGLLREVLLLA